MAGVYATVLMEGVVRKGEPIYLVQDLSANSRPDWLHRQMNATIVSCSGFDQ
jgi:MOSC domain-containing protein YiiM